MLLARTATTARTISRCFSSVTYSSKTSLRSASIRAVCHMGCCAKSLSAVVNVVYAKTFGLPLSRFRMAGRCFDRRASFSSASLALSPSEYYAARCPMNQLKAWQKTNDAPSATRPSSLRGCSATYTADQ